MNNKLDTRDRFVETASKLFESKGYHATGINEILKESRAPKGSLYYYFPNGKEELAVEAVNLSSENIQSYIKKALVQIADPIEAIQVHIETIAAFIAKQEKAQDVSISLLALETSSSSELLRKSCEMAFMSFENIFAEKLIQGGFEEEKAHELSMVIQAMIDGAITISLTKKNGITLLAVAKQIRMLLESNL